MHSLTNPSDMTPQERIAELAAIFAAGFIRLQGHAGHVPLSVEVPEQGSESLARKLSESTGGVRQDEAQCPPRTDDARKGQSA